jgi:hypothetical protein
MMPDRLGGTGKVDFQMDSIRDHELEVSAADILKCRSWLSTFAFSLLIVLPLFGLIYAILSVVLKTDSGSLLSPLITTAILLFFTVWTAMGIPAAIKKLKWDKVVNERGLNNWKIIDENKWEKFSRMLALARKMDKKQG